MKPGALGKESREAVDVSLEGEVNDVCMELFELFEALYLAGYV